MKAYTDIEQSKKLAESEDERIRESIAGFLKTISSLRDGQTLCNEDFDTKVILEWVAWLEKQGEQKPAEWHIEDEQNLNACLGYIPDELLRRWLKDVIHAKYDKPINKDRFNNQESNKDHWQDVRERAAIAAMQGYMSCKCQLVGTINLAMAEGIAEQAILIADVLVKKLKGE